MSLPNTCLYRNEHRPQWWTSASASGPTEAPAPRSVLRRRTPGHARHPAKGALILPSEGGGGGHISFDRRCESSEIAYCPRAAGAYICGA